MNVEYSDIQTDQLTEVFKRALETAGRRRLDTRGDFAFTVLCDVIWELERDRAIWPDVRFAYHYHSNKFTQLPLGKEVINCARGT